MKKIYIQIPKIKNSNYDTDDDIHNFSLSYTREEINMFYYSTHMKEEIYFPNNNKTKSLNL